MQQNPLLRVINRFLNRFSAKTAPSTEPIRVAAIKDIPEGGSLCAEVHGKEISLTRINRNYYAFDNICPHLGGPLCKGKIQQGIVTCPWHGSQFKIEDGSLVRGPAKMAMKTYEVETRGEDIYVKGVTGGTNGKEQKSSPKPAALHFQPTFDGDHPFGYELFYNDVIEGLKFPFKLYGILPLIVIGQSEDELDLHLGEVHVTEMDLKKMSHIMTFLNKKWNTEVTYCLFHSSQFPGDMLLNVRGANAPNNLENDIKF